ncbi:hypothetical protein PT277_09325 [Acetobacteraceae bacterium ESL0709]|nr:hypothetical protein [Acetobacteraceae bacterium ESL0697]MDF7678882.1 hypothetical protein [Acetobacteraceae bacterium ESL0709]
MPPKFQHTDRTADFQSKKNSESHWQRTGEIVMTSATALATFGPQKLRPWFRRFVTVVGIATTIVSLCRRKQ